MASDGSGSSGSSSASSPPSNKLGNRADARRASGFLSREALRGWRRPDDLGRGGALAIGADGELVRRGLAEGHERRGEGDHGHEGAEDLHFWRGLSRGLARKSEDIWFWRRAADLTRELVSTRASP